MVMAMGDKESMYDEEDEAAIETFLSSDSFKNFLYKILFILYIFCLLIH